MKLDQAQVAMVALLGAFGIRWAADVEWDKYRTYSRERSLEDRLDDLRDITRSTAQNGAIIRGDQPRVADFNVGLAIGSTSPSAPLAPVAFGGILFPSPCAPCRPILTQAQAAMLGVWPGTQMSYNAQGLYIPPQQPSDQTLLGMAIGMPETIAAMMGLGSVEAPNPGDGRRLTLASIYSYFRGLMLSALASSPAPTPAVPRFGQVVTDQLAGPLLASQTTVTNTTAETALGPVVGIPQAYLQAGTEVVWEGAGSIAYNSTNTLGINFRYSVAGPLTVTAAQAGIFNTGATSSSALVTNTAASAFNWRLTFLCRSVDTQGPAGTPNGVIQVAGYVNNGATVTPLSYQIVNVATGFGASPTLYPYSLALCAFGVWSAANAADQAIMTEQNLYARRIVPIPVPPSF